MKKTGKILSLILALCMVMSLAAFASDESVMAMNASAEAGAVLVTVGDGEFTDITATAEGVTVTDGTIGAEAAEGVVMNIAKFTTAGFQVTGGEYRIADAVITKEVVEEVDANATGGAIASVSNGVLTIENCSFINNGKGGRNGNYTVECKNTGVLVVIHSDIIQTGSAGDPAGYTADIADPPSNAALTISGYARANMSYGKGQTYYYGSYVETEGWAAMSTDSAQSGFAFYSYDSIAHALNGGYATYADTSCVDWFYATDLIGGEIGAIISNNGEIHMNNGAAATPEALAYLPADYELSESYGDGRSSLQAGRNAVQIHSPDMGGGGARGDYHGLLELIDTDIITSEDLDADCTLIDWHEYNPALGEYVDFVKGAAFLVKSTGAYITLDNCTVDSYSDTLLLTVLNSDSMSRYAHADDDMTGKGAELTIKNSEVSGDVKHFDYQRNCVVTLENATWNGAYLTMDKAAWDALWSEECKADDACYWILDAEKYFDGTGTTASLLVSEDATWNVTGESALDSLSVARGGVVNGTVTVDGAEVDVSAGGSWSGNIVVTPAASAAPAATTAAADDSLPATDGTENQANMLSGTAQPATAAEYDAYEAYLTEYIGSYAGAGDGTFDDGARSMALGELGSVSFGADVNAFPFEMFVTQFGAMDYATFAAQK